MINEEDRELLYQELKNERRQEIVEEFEYEDRMRNDVLFFCEEAVNQQFYVKNKTIDCTDLLVRLKRLCNTYNQDINNVLDYMKEI